MNKIYFVTGNKGKINSAQKHFEKYEIELHLNIFDLQEPYVNDIEFISKYKVHEAYKLVKNPCIALDAGFYIPDYPGNPNFPGAFPKRDLLEAIGIDGLLNNMKNVKNRHCYFKECLSYYDGKSFKQFNGIVEGKLALEKGSTEKLQKWSELWSVFMPKGYDKTISEMTDEEYNEWSINKQSAFDIFAEWFLKQV